MNMLFAFLNIVCLCFLTKAQPIPQPPLRIPHNPYNPLRDVPILALNYDSNPDGSYAYNYETGNGIAAHQRGFVKNLGNPVAEAQVVEGSYTYTGPDGVQYTVNYIADENGFQPQGVHLPTPSPTIQKSLVFNAAHPEPIGPVGPIGHHGPFH